MLMVLGKWLGSIQIVVEMVSMKLGKDEDDNDKFSGHMKLVALLYAISCDGSDALSCHFHMRNENFIYEEAMTHLITIYW